MDLDSLITTIVTSTAALIAIIGGFLVSRVISLSSEQNAIRRRIKEINGELYIKKKQKNEVHQKIIEDDADDFILENISDLVSDEEDIEYIFQSEEEHGLTLQELSPIIEEFYIVRDEMIEIFFSDSVEGYTNDFDEFLSRENIDLESIGRKNWCEWVYNELYSRIPKKNLRPHSLVDMAKLDAIIPPTSDWYNRRVKEREELTNEISLLEKHRADQGTILKDYGQPNGVLGGTIVLAYASIVGIVIPSIFLPYNNAVISFTWDKWILLSLFFSQLAALFIYLGKQVRKLSNLDNEKSTTD